MLPDADQVFKGREDETLTNINITSQQVIHVINRLRINISPGVDEVFPRLLKESKDIISVALTDTSNKSIASGDVPSLWKQANVILIFKKGDKSVMSNYRSISLTSVICKMLESIISRKVQQHLELHKLIINSQHGFTKGKSCITNLLSFYKAVYEADLIEVFK